MVLVSIIIPVFHDWERLAKCLKALSGQSYKNEKFEIIVINNDPADQIPLNYQLPNNCIVLKERKIGSYAARNAGIVHAKGKIIGFTDSDCIPEKYWIENAVKFLDKNKKISRVGGKIELFNKEKKLTISELYEKVFAFKQEEKVKVGASVTANLFVYKDIFTETGMFDEHLYSGGDWEWSQRAELHNYKIAFAENVIIKHPARNKIGQLIKKTVRVAGGKFIVASQLKFKKPRNIPISTTKYYIKKYGSQLTILQKIQVTSISYLLKIISIVIYIKILLGGKVSRE